MSAMIHRPKPALKALSLSSLEYLSSKTLGEDQPSAKKCKLSLRSPNNSEEQFFFGKSHFHLLKQQAVGSNSNTTMSDENKCKHSIPQICINNFKFLSPAQAISESPHIAKNDVLDALDMMIDDDDVFLKGNSLSKENHPIVRGRRQKRCSEKRLSVRNKKSCLSSSSIYGISPPAPVLTINEAVCVNSPERKKLQEIGLDSLNQAVKNSSGYDIKLLGKGGYGTVVLGSWKNMRVAVKVIARDDKAISKSRRRTSIDSEMNAVRIPEHENIVKVHGIFDGMEELHSSVIVMEYVGHYNLQHVIDSQPYKLQNGRFFHCASTEIARGLNHCHKNGIVHLDIKPSNVLVIPSSKPSESWLDSFSSSCSSSYGSMEKAYAQFKIGDFGCSKKVHQRSDALRDKTYELYRALDLSRPLGTPGYQAPEMLNGNGPVTDKCDIYSYGILLWQLQTRTSVPYEGMHQHTVIFKVVSQGLRPNYNDGDKNAHLNYDRYEQIFKSCWEQKYFNRPSMNQVLHRLESMVLSNPKAKAASPNIKLGYHAERNVHRIHRTPTLLLKRRTTIRY